MCSVINKNNDYSSIAYEGYIAKSKDRDHRASSSGRFVDSLLRYLINSGYIVCGAAFGEHLKVEHRFIYNEEDLYKIAGSKYVQIRQYVMTSQ